MISLHCLFFLIYNMYLALHLLFISRPVLYSCNRAAIGVHQACTVTPYAFKIIHAPWDSICTEVFSTRSIVPRENLFIHTKSDSAFMAPETGLCCVHEL